MKRFEIWMHRGIWGVIFGLGIYILVKGLTLASVNEKLEKTAVRACLPAVTYAEREKPEDWFTMLVKETIPLYAYWKEKECYLYGQETEDELIVREETPEGKAAGEQDEEGKTAAETAAPHPEAGETEAEKNAGEEEQREKDQTEKDRTDRAQTEKSQKEKKQKEKKQKKKNQQGENSGNERQKAAEVDRDALGDFDHLIRNYYTVDMSTTADPAQINADTLLSLDMTMEKNDAAPQILIYHTHSQEAFADSLEGDTSTTIVGMGAYLAELLTEKYGYQVMHQTSVFDMIDGELDRNTAYTLAEEEISGILEAYPSIEVVIDLHRDGLEGQKMVTEINGKQTAKIMFFNGLSRTARNGAIDYLPNPYILENLAFSFQLQLKAEEYYPEFMRPIYLQSLRYNLHMKPKSLLIEAGSQLNTVEEERNAMEPLADMLDMVLSGK